MTQTNKTKCKEWDIEKAIKALTTKEGKKLQKRLSESYNDRY